jgi:hypothetical protein
MPEDANAQKIDELLRLQVQMRFRIWRLDRRVKRLSNHLLQSGDSVGRSRLDARPRPSVSQSETAEEWAKRTGTPVELVFDHDNPPEIEFDADVWYGPVYHLRDHVSIYSNLPWSQPIPPGAKLERRVVPIFEPYTFPGRDALDAQIAAAPLETETVADGHRTPKRIAKFAHKFRVLGSGGTMTFQFDIEKEY